MNTCVECDNKTSNPKFCSRSCSVTHNNRISKRRYEIKFCPICEDTVSRAARCCSRKCSDKFIWQEVKNKIEQGDQSFGIRQYKRYVIERDGKKCYECGWAKINTTSGKVPIELHHIDGNSSNHDVDNLILLCPNCHSLTATAKGLNKGNGRFKRRQRYKEKGFC